MDMELRTGNYASSITNLDGILNGINNAIPGTPYYFTVNLQNGTSKVFYYILENGDTTGSFIGKFYRDYTRFIQGGMTGYEDFLIRGFANANAYVENEPESPLIDIVDSSVKTEMLNYIEVFVDAIQAMAAMPY